VPEPSFYDRPAVFARYTSHRHDGTASPNIVMEEPALLAALGSVAGLRVVDLGCGDAELGEIVLAAGARSYVGVDGSAAMVASARSRLGAGAEVRHATIEEFGAPPGSVDVVVSRLALHYVADVRSVLSSACRWLSPAGRVVFSVVHPTITSHDARAGSDEPRTSWVVDDYFATGARERPWLGGSVTWYHRTVEDYVRALLDAGVTLTTLSECAPSLERFAGDTAEYRRRRRVPLFLLLAGTVSAGRR
jgi:SAM-dependent methyltransferase